MAGRVRALGAAALVAGGLVFVAPGAHAGQAVCKQRAEIVALLARKFNETQRSFGLQNDRRVLELYASPDGTWTAILTMPSGRSCVVAAGEAWTVLPPPLVGDPA